MRNQINIGGKVENLELIAALREQTDLSRQDAAVMTKCRLWAICIVQTASINTAIAWNVPANTSIAILRLMNLKSQN